MAEGTQRRYEAPCPGCGAPVPFLSDVDRNMERLGFGLSAELFSEILAASNLSADQAKN